MREAPPWPGVALLAIVPLLCSADPGAARTPGSSVPLDVPYLAQSEALCGGASVAMVLRYWGVRAVQPEDFAPLVDAEREGITTAALVRGVRARGWDAYPFAGTLSALAHHVARGRPLIPLIAVGPGRFHYVVVVDVGPDRVVYHDPAVGPARAVSRVEFDRAWARSSRWTLLILPRAETEARRAERPAQPPPAAPAACAPAVAAAAAAAGDRQYGIAERWLDRARQECPSSAVPLRELAGLRLLQRRPDDAAAIARTAVERDGSDPHLWRVLGASEFLRRDRDAALRAWNRAGEPVADLVRVDGLRRTRHRVVTGQVAIEHGRLLTSAAVARAERRVAAIPSVAASSVELRPAGEGLAEVKADVVERPLMPAGRLALGTLAVRALATREATWSLASLTGSGERLDLVGRWWEARPAARIGLGVPVNVGPARGILRLAGGFARESFGSPASGPTAIEDARFALVSLADWTASGLRWEGAVRIDRWTPGGDRDASLLRTGVLAGVGGSVEQRLAGDRLAGRVHGVYWPAGGFGAAGLDARWRWRRHGVDRLTVSASAALAGTGAPRALWPGAGAGHGRPLLLRAHPLLEDGIVTGDVFGRRLAQASAEWRKPVIGMGPLQIQLAAFVDAAASARGDRRSAAHVDAGGGLRFGVPGEGTLRLDYARGLRDGAHALSVGWELPWPSWP
jgi:hypothetical protein